MMDWTPERKAEAARLWSEGHSLAEIGRRLCVSRMAVSGVAFRNRDLFPTRGRTAGRPAPAQPKAGPRSPAPGSASAKHRRAARKRAPPRPAPRPRAPEPVAPVRTLPATPPIAFLHAVNTERCLHYVGDPLGPGGPDMPVCGAERTGRSRYCLRHQAGQYQAVAA